MFEKGRHKYVLTIKYCKYYKKTNDFVNYK